MGVLAPLFLAGLAALSLPLVLHLVRRTPRGRLDFSSLMFLSPSPPRLTQRSRLDQLVLLALRLLALALLAWAFARPFLRESAMLSLDSLPSRRVALVMDTSASMRRGDLWTQAVHTAADALDNLGPHDDVALFTFSDHLQKVVGFQDERSDQVSNRAGLVRQLLNSLAPTWGATDLGTALVSVAGEMDTASDVQQLVSEPQIVLISDFQKGCRIDALRAFEWPPRVHVVARPVTPRKTTNALVHLLPPPDGSEEQDPRVRVVNASDSSGDQFFVRWADNGNLEAADHETAMYVPAGQSRVLRLPRPPDQLQADCVILRGDDHSFDNTYFVVPPRRRQVRLVYLGTDSANDPQGLQYFLRLAVAYDPLRQVEVDVLGAEDVTGGLDNPVPPLVVLSRAAPPELVAALTAYVERGGMLLVVPRDGAAATALAAFFDDLELGSTDNTPHDYLLLGEIDFAHPLFAPFANPRYSDFAKIHFWKHWPVTLKPNSTTHIVARFDNGDPAVLERARGQGRVLALTSGWNPDDSQLAVSSKFVPLIGGMLDEATGGDAEAINAVVGQPVALPVETGTETRTVHCPDGNDLPLAAGATRFDRTDQPGIYHVRGGPREVRFAVNLALAEGDTAPLSLDQLEQWGVRFGIALTRAERLDRQRQQRDTELENQQKLWRWLIVAAIGILIVETWWACRAARQANQAMESAV